MVLKARSTNVTNLFLPSAIALLKDYIRILNRPLVLSKYFDFFKSTFFSRDHMVGCLLLTSVIPVLIFLHF